MLHLTKMKNALSRVLAVLLCVFTAVMPFSGTAFAAEAGSAGEADAYTVTLADSENGGLSFSEGDGNTMEFAEGDEVVVDIEPAEGYEFESISITLTETGEEAAASAEAGSEQFSFTMPAADVTVTATFCEDSILSDEFIAAMAELQASDDYISAYELCQSNNGRIRAFSSSTEEVSLSKGDSVTYNGYSTHYYSLSDGTQVFCAQPSQSSPSNGTYTATEWDDALAKTILYFGYGGPGYVTTIEKENDPYSLYFNIDEENRIWAYVYTHLMISWVLDGCSEDSDAFKGVNTGLAEGIKTLVNFYANYTYRVPSGYTVYQINTGSSTQVMAYGRLTETTGYVTLQKASSDTGMTDGNSNYSLAGAVYGVYSDSECTTQVETLTTTDDGSSNTVELDEGTYYVKEISASPGFGLDTNAYSVTVTADETATVSSVEPPQASCINLMKASGNTDITDDNPCYSLEGAVYGVYTDSDCTALVGELTTDADGNTETMTVALGVYYVKEISASPGYALDETIYPVAATSGGQTYTVSSIEPPTNDPAGITLNKIDQDTGDFTASGGASLAGAQFTITHYAGYYTEDEIAAGKPEEDGVQVRTWVVETVEYTDSLGNTQYYARLGNDDCLVSGDPYYYDSDGNVCLPLGTVTVEETKAPTGYQLDGGYITYVDGDGNTVTLAGTYYYTQVYQNDDIAYINGGNEYTQSDVVKRGDFEFTKKNDSYENMANVKWSITSNTTGESHIIWTDENGYYSTSSDYILHSENTNSGEPESGIWFGLNADGTSTEVDDSQGALPYDTYTVQELRCDANTGMSLRTFTVTISRDGFLVDMGTIVDSSVVIETTATDSETGTHLAVADEDVTIEDSVYYELTESGTYTIKGILMDKSTGTALLDADGNEITAELTFTASALRGTKVLSYTFDASLMAGTDVVVFEYLYNEDGDLIAEHTDIDDEDQTVGFSSLGTTALDAETNTHLSNADEEITIIDTLEYSGLASIAGKKVTVTGTLMDKSTGEALLDDDGNEITATDTFTVNESGEGTYNLAFTFSGTCLEGTTAVAFESISYNGYTVATHMDIDDDDQTIWIPKVRTKAEDLNTGTNTSMASEETTIVDHVYVYNLIAGKEYTITGVLMDQSTGEALLDADGNEVTSSVTFTATSANGTVDMEFTFDSSLLAGTTVVVFEDLYYEGKLVGTHSDLTDEAQAITFPKIGTTATDASDGDKYITATEDVTIDDLVEYTGLAPDVEYKMVLTVMDKSTGQALLVNGTEVTAEVEFVPEDTDGSVTVSVTFDASALSDGTELVMFEKVYMKDSDGNWVEVANHEDLDDEGQTVTVTSTTKNGVSTGDNFNPIAADLAGCIAAAGIAGVLVRRRRRLY